MATKTYEEYQKTQRAAADTQIAAAAAEKKAADADALAGEEKRIDSQTESRREPYEEKLARAPGEYQTLFDRHALDEELERQAVEVRMANMGLTDSGLAASSQAAASTRRRRANADARQSLQAYVDELQTAIRQVEAEGEAKKAELRLKSDKAYDTWYAKTKEKAYTQADKTAKTLYKAAQDAARKTTAPKGTATQGTTTQGTVTPGATTEDAGAAAPKLPALLKGVFDGIQAGAQAVIRGDGVVPTDPQSTDSAAEQAKKEADEAARQEAASRKAVEAVVEQVGQLDASAGGIFNTTYWAGPEGDGENVYEDIVEEQLQRVVDFSRLSKAEKANAVAIAIGKSVATTWPEFGQNRSNMVRIETALNCGKKAYGWSDKEWQELRAVAKTAYNELRP